MNSWDVVKICMKFDADNSGDICADEFAAIISHDVTRPDTPDKDCKCGRRFLKADAINGNDNGVLDTAGEIADFTGPNWANEDFNWETECAVDNTDEITWAEAECICDEGLNDD